jgi:hypothetical protein
MWKNGAKMIFFRMPVIAHDCPRIMLVTEHFLLICA